MTVMIGIDPHKRSHTAVAVRASRRGGSAEVGSHCFRSDAAASLQWGTTSAPGDHEHVDLRLVTR